MLKPLLIAAAMLIAPGGQGAEKPAAPQPTKAVPQPSSDAAPLAAEQAPTNPQEADKTALDVHAENPPPTTWDKSQDKSATKTSTDTVDENTLTEQLFQTLIALIFVCLLIYLVGRFGLSRLTSLRTGAPTQTLSLNEKLSLDAKNALYIVEVKGRGKLLLGGGDQGLNLICNLDEDSAFGKSMNRTQSPLVDSTPGAEVQREQHG